MVKTRLTRKNGLIGENGLTRKNGFKYFKRRLLVKMAQNGENAAYS